MYNSDFYNSYVLDPRYGDRNLPLESKKFVKTSVGFQECYFWWKSQKVVFRDRKLFPSLQTFPLNYSFGLFPHGEGRRGWLNIGKTGTVRHQLES